MVVCARAQETTTYGYDPLGRLGTSAVSGGPNTGFTSASCFDAASNRTQLNSAFSTSTCTPTPGPAPTPSTNHAPVATSDFLSLGCNTGTGYNVLTNDSDPDADALTLTSAGSNGSMYVSVASSSGYLSVGAGPNAGTFTGSYVVTDSHGATTIGTISVSVSHGGPGGC